MTQILPQPGEHFSWISTNSAGPVLQCGPLAAIAPHVFTTRVLRLRGDSPEAADHWAAVASTIGVPPAQLRRMRQVHGCSTVAADSQPPAHAPEADGVMTDEKGIALVVQVADCVPLLMADPRSGAVAAVHAGWRGTAANIAAAAVRRLQQQYGSRPEDLVAAIGPSIGACCYQVGPEVREAFTAPASTSASSATSAGPLIAPLDPDGWFSPDPNRDDRLRFDGWAANRDQLIAAGLDPANVYLARLCTMTHLSHFYSYRAEGAGTGRLLGVIRRAS